MNEQKLYTTKEVVTHTELDADLIRKYCKHFNIQTQWSKPNNKGHRRFTKRNIEQLLEIKRLIKDENLSWDQARSYLNGDSEVFTSTETRSKIEEKLDQLIEENKELKENQERTNKAFSELLTRLEQRDRRIEELDQKMEEQQLLLEENQEQNQESKTSFFAKLFGKSQGGA